jgi:hypothetical protein
LKKGLAFICVECAEDDKQFGSVGGKQQDFTSIFDNLFAGKNK